MANRTNLTTLRVISAFLVAPGAAATAAGATIYVDADAIGAKFFNKQNGVGGRYHHHRRFFLTAIFVCVKAI